MSADIEPSIRRLSIAYSLKCTHKIKLEMFVGCPLLHAIYSFDLAQMHRTNYYTGRNCCWLAIMMMLMIMVITIIASFRCFFACVLSSWLTSTLAHTHTYTNFTAITLQIWMQVVQSSDRYFEETRNAASNSTNFQISCSLRAYLCRVVSSSSSFFIAFFVWRSDCLYFYSWTKWTHTQTLTRLDNLPGFFFWGGLRWRWFAIAANSKQRCINYSFN